MKSFMDFLAEGKKSEAPQGVIFMSDKLVFVGTEHGKPVQLSDEILSKIKKIGERYGFWYEGNGGDADTNKRTFGPKSSYKGSWDEDGFNRQVRGYPMEFLYTIFTNTAVNKQKENLVSPGVSIFDNLIKNQKKFAYFKDREYDAATLKKFLRAASEVGVDFLKLSQMPATRQNAASFIDKGEKLMWPKNWDKYPNKSGKIAYKANLLRNKYLLTRKEGVYFMGSGHLTELREIDSSLKIIGGEDIE